MNENARDGGASQAVGSWVLDSPLTHRVRIPVVGVKPFTNSVAVCRISRGPRSEVGDVCCKCCWEAKTE